MKKTLNFILLTFLYGSLTAQTDTFYIFKIYMLISLIFRTYFIILSLNHKI